MKKLVDGVMKGIQVFLGILLSCAVLIVLAQVFFRYVLKTPLGWTDQLCRFLFVWIVLMGLPLLFHNKAATAFDLLSGKLKGKAHDGLQLLICALGIVFAAAFFVFSWQFMMKKGHQMIPAFRVVPYYAVYAALPLSAAVLFLEEASQMLECLKRLLRAKKGGEA